MPRAPRTTTARQLGPILDLPRERPTCAGCGVPLRPVVSFEYERVMVPAQSFAGGDGFTATTVEGHRNIYRRRRFIRWDCYNGLFHTLKCALAFATAAHAAGYRRQRGK